MNSKLKSILDQYEDFELAFLSQYKLSTYLEGTRDSIIEYIKLRGLSQERIKTLIEETERTKFEDEHLRCPRCKSKKLNTDKVEWTQTDFKAGYSDEAAGLDGLIGKATFKDRIICDVCEYYILDPNNEQPTNKRTFWKKAYDFLVDQIIGI